MKPVATYLLIAITAAVYVGGNPQSLWLWPLDSLQFQPWQMVTYAFAHGNAFHLVLNLLVLLSFGPTIERATGWGGMLSCYLFSTILGGALQQAMGGDVPTVGSSGALFGLFAAYTVMRPKAKLISLAVIPLPAYVVLGVYTAFSVAAVLNGWLPRIGHLVHLGGTVTGVVFALALRPEDDKTR